jgi:antitoxin ParD1/3/4
MMVKLIRKTIDVHNKQPISSEYVNLALLDATTDADIEKHKAEDDAAALFDAVQFAKSNKIALTRKAVNWHNMPIPLSKDTPMPTRNVVITDQQALMIEELVSSGRYQNASEVLREGLRMLDQREKEDALKLKALQAAVQVGLDDIKAGRFKEFDSKASLRKHLKSVLSKVTTVT